MEVNSFQTPNQLVDEYLAELNGNELKILLVIIRKTKGWNKEFDGISISQFQKFTGIKNDKTVRKAIKKLINLGLIEKVDNAGKFSLYRLTPPATNDGGQKMVGLPKNDPTPLPKIGRTPLPTNDPHKYTLPKNTNTKENKNNKEPLEEKQTNSIKKLMDLIRDFYKENKLSLTGNKVFQYERKLYDLSQRYPLEEIEEVINFAKENDFYKKQLTNPNSLFNNFESMKLAYEDEQYSGYKEPIYGL